MYSLGLLPLAASGWIAGQLDKLLITWFGSLEESGIYSVAFEVGRIMSLFVRSLFMVYTPMIYAMLKEDAKKNVARIEQFQSFFLHALIGIAFFVSIFCPEIFQLFVHEKYHQGVGLVPVIAFALVFGGIRKLYANLIFYHKLTLFISIGGIIQALLGFGLNVLLIPRFGGQGAAWARFVSTFVVAVYFYLLSRKYEPLRVDRAALKATISIFIGCLAILLFCVYVLKLTFWPLLTAKVMIFFLAVVLTWFSRFGDELRRVLSKRKRKDTVSDEQIESTYDSISESQEI
jgi:O-antigen/teichoic acid export membrane protein